MYQRPYLLIATVAEEFIVIFNENGEVNFNLRLSAKNTIMNINIEIVSIENSRKLINS